MNTRELARSPLAEALRRLLPARWLPIGYLTHLTRTGTSDRVAAGPFAGMCYVESSVGSAYIPKLLGIYERELNPFVERACAEYPGLVIDLGAAEGYYAVGLARRLPAARVVAFEMDPAGRANLAAMAQLNDVADRVDIQGRAEPADLAAALAGARETDGVLVVCDVEGYEMTLLDPTQVPPLLTAHIMVELHDFVERGIAEAITARFAPTHDVTRVWQEDRSRTEFPFQTLYTRLLPRSYLDWTVSEWRPERMSWLWMEPRPETVPRPA